MRKYEGITLHILGSFPFLRIPKTTQNKFLIWQSGNILFLNDGEVQLAVYRHKEDYINFTN